MLSFFLFFVFFFVTLSCRTAGAAAVAAAAAASQGEQSCCSRHTFAHTHMPTLIQHRGPFDVHGAASVLRVCPLLSFPALHRGKTWKQRQTTRSESVKRLAMGGGGGGGGLWRIAGSTTTGQAN